MPLVQAVHVDETVRAQAGGLRPKSGDAGERRGSVSKMKVWNGKSAASTKTAMGLTLPGGTVPLAAISARFAPDCQSLPADPLLRCLVHGSIGKHGGNKFGNDDIDDPSTHMAAVVVVGAEGLILEAGRDMRRHPFHRLE